MLELAVPLLRLLATQRPGLCKGVVDTEGTDALDRLESDLLDEKAKLEKATGLALILLLPTTFPKTSQIQSENAARKSLNRMFCLFVLTSQRISAPPT